MKNRSRKLAKSAAVFAASALALTACGSGGNSASNADSSLADMDDVVLQTQSPYGPNHFMSNMWTEYAEAVEEASDGKITIDIAYSSSLVPVAEQEAAIRDGLIDIAWSMPVYNPGGLPLNALISEMAFFTEQTPLVSQLQGYGSAEFGFREEVVAELDEAGLFPLMSLVQQMPSYGMVCTDEAVTSLDDFAGKRVRIPGVGWANEVEALGGTPVNLVQAEVYEGLERGIIDCAVVSPGNSVDAGLFDVTDHWTTVGFQGWSSTQIIMSKSKWESLPVEAQRILWDEAGNTLLRSMIQDSMDAGVREIQAAEGSVETHQFEDDVQEALAAYRETALEDIDARADEMLGEDQTLIEDYKATQEKWLKIVTEELGYSDEEHPTAEGWAAAYSENPVDIDPFVKRFISEVMDPHRP
jgi:TRAP-type C4-dicarboxylate transport system substrate-binding protein